MNFKRAATSLLELIKFADDSTDNNNMSKRTAAYSLLSEETV